jgi:hypothetical protein
MVELNYEITRFDVCVPLTEEQWEALDRLSVTKVINALEKAGAFYNTVDWNGHFGRNLFFSADADYEKSGDGRANIYSVIRRLGELLSKEIKKCK